MHEFSGARDRAMVKIQNRTIPIALLIKLIIKIY
jgi:hypothetical protein